MNLRESGANLSAANYGITSTNMGVDSPPWIKKMGPRSALTIGADLGRGLVRKTVFDAFPALCAIIVLNSPAWARDLGTLAQIL